MADSEVTRSDEETEDEVMEDSVPTAGPHRSRATSPSASAPSDEVYARLTARQRARMEKEAGLAEDLQWHEMDLLPNLTYTWKGKGPKVGGQMTEEEWLKRQEALERRRMRSLRDKREAEEAVKAKIRRAVTARFRGKLGADAGLDGQGAGGEEQEGSLMKPGWVRMRYTHEGVKVAWHPAAHPLSLPVPVAAAPNWPLEPVDVSLQPPDPGQPWQVPPGSSSNFKPGSVLTLQQTAAAVQQPAQVQLCCRDSHGWTVGSLLQQEVLQALEFGGHWQPQQEACGEGTAAQPDWQCWRAVVKSIRHNPDKQLAAVIVRLVSRPPD